MSDFKGSGTPSAQKLFDLRREILLDWEKRVREHITAATDLLHSLIIDTVPAFLDNLAEALCESHPRQLATDSTTISQEHGGERARLTRYGPEQLLKEYQLLRETILDHLNDTDALTTRDRRIIQMSFDHAVQEGMAAFFLVQSRIREQFVAGLGHDLRNPLGAMKMSGELILMATEVEPSTEGWNDIKGLAQRIVVNARRVDRMIQDMLDATSIQTGERLSLFLADHEILALIKESVEDLARTDQQRIHVSGESVWGQWDGEAIRRTIENLIANAMKYGTPKSKISVRVRGIEGRLIVTVHNVGSYIPVEEQESLFQAFRRSESAQKSKTKGWGLGLALVRSVAEAHGGSVVVDSSPEMGTTFTFDIPIDARPFVDAPVVGS